MTLKEILDCKDVLLLLQRLNELKGFSDSELRDMGKKNKEAIEAESSIIKVRIRDLRQIKTK